jgi:ribosome-associated heat shock protein Hsp15
MLLTIRQGFDVKEVTVIALSDQRRGAPEAALLYQETEASIKKREDMAAQRKTLSGTGVITEGRPSKKQRRQIHRFKDLLNDE